MPGVAAGGMAGIPEAAGSGAADGAGIVPPLPLMPSGALPPARPPAPGLLPAPTCASPVVGAATGALEVAAGAFAVLPATPGVGASLRWHETSSTRDATATAAASLGDDGSLDMRFLRQIGMGQIIEVRAQRPCRPTSLAIAGSEPVRGANRTKSKRPPSFQSKAARDNQTSHGNVWGTGPGGVGSGIAGGLPGSG